MYWCIRWLDLQRDPQQVPVQSDCGFNGVVFFQDGELVMGFDTVGTLDG